jgi:glycosyltransferase involved in cell wall biosynthesis
VRVRVLQTLRPISAQASGSALGEERRYRVLFIVNSLWFFQNHRLPIAVAAQGRGYDVAVAAPLDEYAGRVRSHGIAVHDLPMRRSMSPVSDLLVLWRIARLIRRLSPDLVHLVTAKPVAYGGLCARLLRVPAVVSAISGLGYVFIADDGRSELRRRSLLALYRVALGHPNQTIIFQNIDDRRVFAEAGACDTSRTVLIEGCGVRLGRGAARRTGPPAVMLGARLLVDKGVREFVAAAGIVRAFRPDCRFVLVGEIDPGNPASISRAELEGWVGHGVVEWLGWQDDVQSVLRDATIACLPSYREGLPKFLIEAAAAGLPIVTTDVPGCRDVVRHGFNGFLVPARDAHSLAHAILQLLDAPEEGTRMGRNSRRMARARFNVHDVTLRTVDLYDDLLKEASSP